MLPVSATSDAPRLPGQHLLALELRQVLFHGIRQAQLALIDDIITAVAAMGLDWEAIQNMQSVRIGRLAARSA